MFVCYFLFCGHWKQMLEQFFFSLFLRDAREQTMMIFRRILSHLLGIGCDLKCILTISVRHYSFQEMIFVCRSDNTESAQQIRRAMAKSFLYVHLPNVHGEFGKRQMNAPHSSDFWYFSPHILTLRSFSRSLFILLAGSWTVSFMISTEQSTVILAKTMKKKNGSAKEIF